MNGLASDGNVPKPIVPATVRRKSAGEVPRSTGGDDAAFYALYACPMGREYAWTDAGKVSAADHGVTERETVEALYSSQRIENEIGTLLLAVAGLADTSRVIVVLCERIANVNSFAIIAVRSATPEEIKLWMEGTR